MIIDIFTKIQNLKVIVSDTGHIIKNIGFEISLFPKEVKKNMNHIKLIQIMVMKTVIVFLYFFH